MEKILLETNRSGYSTDQIDRTLTAGALIEMLQEFDEDTPVYFSNDNGYTYGGLWYNTLTTEYDDESGDE